MVLLPSHFGELSSIHISVGPLALFLLVNITSSTFLPRRQLRRKLLVILLMNFRFLEEMARAACLRLRWGPRLCGSRVLVNPQG